MANDKIKKNFKDIADAIRSKTGENGTMTAEEMPSKIEAIETGIEPTGTINITANGVHDVAQYGEANVNVPQPTGFTDVATNGIHNVAQYEKVRVTVGAICNSEVPEIMYNPKNVPSYIYSPYVSGGNNFLDYYTQNILATKFDSYTRGKSPHFRDDYTENLVLLTKSADGRSASGTGKDGNFSVNVAFCHDEGYPASDYVGIEIRNLYLVNNNNEQWTGPRYTRPIHRAGIDYIPQIGELKVNAVNTETLDPFIADKGVIYLDLYIDDNIPVHIWYYGDARVYGPPSEDRAYDWMKNHCPVIMLKNGRIPGFSVNDDICYDDIYLEWEPGASSNNNGEYDSGDNN